ncbi:TPA: hypothetical protein NVQ95_001890 [Acinetobacter baumannii]|uniref:hypothetical protein n=1 Tax=Acinetobacter baumannii TaxID=470 RepID=UPI0006ABFAB9|nr:hypothetical protein [Acinetobacter baumannii]EKU0985923.1 hypothetical protein [Acinetobacter baumannii]EKU6410949.1 hypothetical protein [Acinetobacter baumannii]EKU7898379.1 hypothetical protein [Acinetobacter baumannii]EKX1710546.1 hypothetical protein [Acinetobacter baumannii]EKY1453280.1 hypothetical protein [Acinetobacter baumannii]
MADLTAKKVSKLIEEFRQTGKEPEKLVIGYKTYARLMADDKFAEKVVPSLENSKDRLYKNLKINLVKLPYHINQILHSIYKIK